MDCFAGLYCCMFLVGIVGNAGLGLTLCCGHGTRSRNPLLLGLITADLLVCGLSGPITASFYLLPPWSQPWLCVALFMQAWPVSASTLSMMAISVDRYMTVKNYRPAVQVVRRRHILYTAVATTWISAAILSCLQFLQKNSWRRSVVIVRVIFIYLVPACAVLASHLGVHAKLTALSLTARAKHGELPLPMPLLRRPANVIIIAGISNKTKVLHAEDTIRRKEESENGEHPAPSTLRSRRILANSLLLAAAMFVGCWLPHVVCIVTEEISSSPPLLVQRFSLFLGHIHSLFSPFIYLALNHQWLSPPCSCRLPGSYQHASSTNEAALGPFNPRLVRPPPVRHHSSHYLY